MIRQPLALILVLALTLCAGAQTPIGGNVFDGNGGPLLSGVVYHSTTSITVPAGETLTIQPGAIVKMGSSHTFFVQGHLSVTASSGNPAIITALTDDTAGGDTNGDGSATAPAPDFWRTLSFSGNATGNVSGVEVRYAGRFNNGGIELSSTGVVTLTDCRVRDCTQAGLDLNNGSSAVVTGCAFDNNGRAVEGVALAGLPNFTNNTATGNQVHDTIDVSSGNLATGTTVAVTAANMLSNVVFVPSITVQSGASLSLDQGVIFKFKGDSTVAVGGTFDCTGTAGNPVALTVVADDSRGGDSNKDGMTTGPIPDTWRTVTFTSSSPSAWNETELAFAGRFNNGGVEVAGTPLTLTNCRIVDCSRAALDANNVEAAFNVSGCDFQRCESGIVGVPLESLPGFTNNTASNNTLHDTIAISSATLAAGTTTMITADNMLSNVVFCPSINVATGATLVVDEGCIFKMNSDSTITINGDFTCNGTSADAVVFTSILDDAQGGDSNNDGAATVPNPDWWRTMFFGSTADAQLTQTDIWYAGRFNNAGMEMSGATVTLDGCSVNSSTQAGLDLNNTEGTYQFLNCAWSGNDRAVEGVPLEEVPNFIDNIAAANTTSDTLRVSSATITTGVVSITTSNLISGTILCPSITVAAGAKLAFGAGCIVKMNADSTNTIGGELECLGSAGSPVVFTDFRDDSFGGDTNKDGASSGVNDWWRTTQFSAGSGASRIENTVFRYAGRFNNAAVGVSDDVTFLGCTVDSSTNAGFNLFGSDIQPTMENCTVTNCGGVAIDGMRWAAFENMIDNAASGNGGDYARVTNSAVGASDRVRSYSAPNGVVRMSSDPGFGMNSSLVIDAGIIVKVDSDRSFNVGNGSFRALGTAFEPVVITDFNDDSFGGDSNNDGPSTGTPNWWRGMRADAGATAFELDHFILRFAGRFNNVGLVLNNPAAEVRALRVDSCLTGGVSVLQMSGDCNNWLVHSCAGSSIHLGPMAPNVAHATVADGVTGISADPMWTGTVTNTISWNNSAANYSGIADAAIFSSNGSSTAAGMNGNLDADPMFEDSLSGDYSLAISSPCIDTADIATADAVIEDHLEGSRRSDDDLSGMVLPDMGAFEKITFNLDVQGAPKIGGMQTYGFTGPMAAVGLLLVTPLNEVSTFSPNYGWLLVAPPSEVTLIAAMAPGVPLVAAIPDFPALIDYPFQAQALVVDMTDPTRGNFTQRYRTRVRP